MYGGKVIIFLCFVSDYQLALHAPRISRRKSLWFPTRDNKNNKNNQNGQPRQYVPHICSTKRGGSVLAENFLHPIEQFRTHNPSDIPAANPKRSLFSATSKKKIGPIEMVDTATDNNTSSAGTNHAKKNGAFALNKKFLKNRSIEAKSIEFLKDTTTTTPPSKEGIPITKTTPTPPNVFSLKSKFEDSDFQDEQKGFVMLPTNGTPQDMDDIEREARRILDALGISNTMLKDALPSGPRSDIIGAYRIIVHRLQKQAMLVKQAESIVIEEPAKPKNTRKACVIL